MSKKSWHFQNTPSTGCPVKGVHISFVTPFLLYNTESNILTNSMGLLRECSVQLVSIEIFLFARYLNVCFSQLNWFQSIYAWESDSTIPETNILRYLISSFFSWDTLPPLILIFSSSIVSIDIKISYRYFQHALSFILIFLLSKIESVY